jgi:hypothetical protein
MFAFINTTVPFRNLKLVGDSIIGVLLLRRHVRILEFAVKVHWDSGGKSGRCPSIKPWSVAGQSFQIMLLVLQNSTSLHTLQLHCVEIKPSHQAVILSIPTLKTLISRHLLSCSS